MRIKKNRLEENKKKNWLKGEIEKKKTFKKDKKTKE
jgi:hypothetical protein